VCLLNAYANPAHEQQIKAIVERRVPGMPFCISTDVLPEIREYERSSTTVINAYVMPVVQRYLRTLRAGLGEIAVRTPLLIIQSNGGLMTAEAASRMPMHIIESGPAAGVIGAQALARRTGMAKIITFDMGGTTAKASIVEDGEVNRATEYPAARHPVARRPGGPGARLAAAAAPPRARARRRGEGGPGAGAAGGNGAEAHARQGGDQGQGPGGGGGRAQPRHRVFGGAVDLAI